MREIYRVSENDIQYKFLLDSVKEIRRRVAVNFSAIE